MSNGNDLILPKASDTVLGLSEAPLGQNLTPEPIDPPTFKLPKASETIMAPTPLDYTPVSLSPDLEMFHEEEARQRDIYRDYGVQIRPGINLEESAAAMQSTASKWGNGAVKMLGTATTTFLEPFVDIFVGIPHALGTGKFSGIWDNPIAQSFDSFHEYLRKELPNFYSQAEKDYGFWRSLGTANFWSDQGLQGVGFLAGAIGSGYAAGASGVIGKSSRAIGMGRVKAWRNVVNKWRDSNLAYTASEISKLRNTIGHVNTTAQSANLFGAGLFSAIGEAGIEARESKRRATEVINQAIADGDPRYVGMTDQDVDILTDTAANMAFGLNALIVGGSNILQFGKMFSRGWSPTSTKYMKGRISETAPLKYKFKDLSKGQKRAAQTAAWFKRPSVEAFEEWSQAAINVGVEDYFTDVYSSDPWSEMSDYIEGGMGIMGSLLKGYVEAPQTKEGQQAIFLGALLGKLGEVGSSLREEGVTSRQEWVKTYERTKDLVTKLNGLDPNGTLAKLLKAHAQIQKSQGRLDKHLEAGDVFSYKNEESRALFSLIDTYIEAGRVEDLKAFVDSLETLTNEEFKEAMGIPEDVNIKDVSEQVRQIKDKIEFIEKEKPKVDKFILGAKNLDDFQKAIVGEAIRYYSYMADTLDTRRASLSQEISELSNGNINFDSLLGIDIGSVEHKSALADMLSNANEDNKVTEINKNEYAPLLGDIGMVEALRQEYVKLVNEIVSKELEPSDLKGVDKQETKTKTESETEAKEVRDEILQEEDDALAESKEQDIAEETKLRREQQGTKRERKLAAQAKEEELPLIEQLEKALTITPEEKEQALKDIAKSTKSKFKALAKELGIPMSEDVENLLSAQDAEIERLISLEERGVDIEATEETPIGVLLSHPNASVQVRFMGQEGLLFRDTETGEIIFETQAGEEYVLGQNINENTLSEFGVEALESQHEAAGIRIIADGRTFEINGEYYNNLFINPLSAIDPFIFRQDQPGYVPKRVTLFDSNGKKVTFVNPFIVQEISRLITLIEVIKKEAQLELLDTKGDQVFEFEGKKYYIEDTVEQRYSTAFERKQGFPEVIETPVSIVYNEKLNKLRSPAKIAQVLKARDAHIENYVQNKINKYKEEYYEDVFGKRSDANTAARTEEEVKQDASESTSEPLSAESIGAEQTAPDKTDAQANAKPKVEEIERGAETTVESEEREDESPFHDNTVSNEVPTDESPQVTAEETEVADLGETREAVVHSSELNIDVPNNNDVDISNEAANAKDSSITEEIQPLKTILSLAWKSLNHPWESGEISSFNERLVSLLEGNDTTEFGKLKKDGTVKGFDVVFKIDLNDPNLTKVAGMEAILNKVKNKKSLTQAELDKLPIKALIQVPNAKSSTGISQFQTYVHLPSYIEQHIKEKEHEEARRLLADLRKTVYTNYVKGIESRSVITDMTGGHLNNVNKTAKNNINTVLNLRRPGNPIVPQFIFARNGNYINEHGEVDTDLQFLSVKPKLDEEGNAISNNDGAVYVKVPMNNGEIFPLRVFTSDLNKDLAALVYQLYAQVLKGDSLNSEISRYELLQNSEQEIYKDLAKILDEIKEAEAPTYNQILDILVYKGKKTINSKAPTLHYSNGTLYLGDKTYTAKEWGTQKDEIIEYLMGNMRSHVNVGYMNSKTQNAYNTFLTTHKLVYTNAFANKDTGSIFVQPTVRFSPINAPRGTTAPLPGPSPVVKPEAPVAEKVSVSPDQVEISDIYKSTSEISNIGTQEQYAEYLNSVFPNSKVKEVFHHWSMQGVPIGEKISSDISGRVEGIWLSRNKEEWKDIIGNKAKRLGQSIKENYVMINSLNPFVSATITSPEGSSFPSGYDSVIAYEEAPNNYEGPLKPEFKTIDDFESVVKSKDQIYVLGTSKDIAGFKAFVEKEPVKPIQPKTEGVETMDLSDLPADMQADAMAALEAMQAEMAGLTGATETDLQKDQELIDAGLGNIVPTYSKLALKLKEGTVITGKELKELQAESGLEQKLPVNLQNEEGNMSSEETIEWGDPSMFGDPMSTFKSEDIDNSINNLECD